MPYLFARENIDYSAFASGQVLHSLPGRTAFPVRLGSEMFQRCAALLAAAGAPGPYRLYDPCCGGAQLLTTLALLHGDRLAGVTGSDIDPVAIGLAERNLGLLTVEGIEARMAQLADLHRRHGKASHGEALAHAASLRQRILAGGATRPIATRTFVADATRADELRRQFGAGAIEMVLADVPYGRQSAWQGGADGEATTADPLALMLGALRLVLADRAVVAIAADRAQAIRHPSYRRAARLQIGKRHIVFLVADGG